MAHQQDIPAASLEVLQSQLDRLLESRAFPKTICPSEGPRALSRSELEQAGVSSWRDLMPTARALVWDMMQVGEVEVLQGGEPLDRNLRLEDVKGPIRVRKIRSDTGE